MGYPHLWKPPNVGESVKRNFREFAILLPIHVIDLHRIVMTKSQSLRFNHVQAPIFQRFPKIVVVPPVLIHLLWWMLHRKSMFNQ